MYEQSDHGAGRFQSIFSATRLREPARRSPDQPGHRRDLPTEGSEPDAHRGVRPERAAAEMLPVDVSRIERAIDMRKLRYFVSIVEEGSFSIAAKRVHVAQPALSHHVQELEAALGVALLTRSTHGVFPTEAGQCLYDHGQSILGRVRDAAIEVSGFNREHGAQTVCVGLHNAAASLITPPLFEAVRASAPELQLAIEEGSDRDMLRWMQTKRLDIALLYGGLGDRAFSEQPLLTEALTLIGPAGMEGSRIGLGEALLLPMILPRRPNLIRERLEAQAEAAHLPLDVVIEVDSVSSIKKLVAAGMGYSVLSEAEIVDEYRLGTLQKRSIAAPELRQTLFLCQLRAGQPTRAAMTMKRLVRQVIGDMITRAAWPGTQIEQAGLSA
jgi:LysR family nitrogen assimilation transcriptional regulator